MNLNICLIHDYIDTFSYLKFFTVPSSLSFILRTVLNHHKRSSSTKLPGSTDQFPFESTWRLSSTRDKEKGTTWLQWEGDKSSLTHGWCDSYAFPQHCMFAYWWLITLMSADRHTDKKTYRLTDRQIGRETYRQTDRHFDIQTVPFP